MYLLYSTKEYENIQKTILIGLVENTSFIKTFFRKLWWWNVKKWLLHLQENYWNKIKSYPASLIKVLRRFKKRLSINRLTLNFWNSNKDYTARMMWLTLLKTTLSPLYFVSTAKIFLVGTQAKWRMAWEMESENLEQ